MEDERIVSLYHRREESAISQTADKYGPLLYKIAIGILYSHEDSEETVNDTYGKAWNSMPPNAPRFLCAYLGRITRNLSISRYRKDHAQKRAGVLLELSDCIVDGLTPEQELEAKELGGVIDMWLGKLPKNDRVLFLKRYFFNLEPKELATESGMSIKQLHSRLFRLRQKLKTHLEQEGYYE